MPNDSGSRTAAPASFAKALTVFLVASVVRHLVLSPVVVHVVEVADQRDAHVVVGDLVRLGVAEDAHDAGLGFSVLVVAQRDGHRSLLGSWVVSRRAGSAVAGG